ncbi:MAG: hypothetical protein EBY76_06475, partial [Betaproteobacteria bacterium]|nr:hypothetical protein [Betaproteobacteria bacterium]
MNTYQSLIEQAWEDRTSINSRNADRSLREAVQHVLEELDAGRLRVAEQHEGQWQVHQWIKKAVLLSFRLEDNQTMPAGPMQFYDKVPTKFVDYDAARFAAAQHHGLGDVVALVKEAQGRHPVLDRRAIGALHAERVARVVAPAQVARELVDRHQADAVGAEFLHVIELVDAVLEGRRWAAARRGSEGADV